MQYDLSQSPFSRRGSYLQIERGFDFDNPRVFLGSARRKIWRRADDSFGTHFFTLQLTAPQRDADYTVSARPWRCAGVAEGGAAWRVAIADADTMLFRGAGSGLCFCPTRSMGWAEHRSSGVIVIYDMASDCVHHFKLQGPGRLELRREVDQSRRPKQGAHRFLFTVVAEPAQGHDRVEVAYRHGTDGDEQRFDEPVVSLDEAEASARADYERWAAKRPAVLDEHADMADFAWFMLWNQEVAKGGPLGDRRAIIMSRYWMNRTWAWDACFDAMGVCGADADLAWDQVMLHFDHQRANGQLPDSVCDCGPVYGFAKPPVQGWTVMQLLRDFGVEASMDRLPEVYEKMLAWQNWWYQQRCDRADGLCRYMHGNDSGWDNSTVFADGRPVISPDLQALLTTQWKTLARIATILGRSGEAREHEARAARQVQAMRDAMVIDGRFGYIDAAGQLQRSTSTLTRMAVMLGADLPDEVRAGLVADLSPASPHITAFGVATEATDSPHYLEDGYWRGPIWAPEQWMAIDGLRRADAGDAAADLAKRFCRLCNQPGSAMHENYNAQTGQGLRSPAYSWTAAVYLVAARWLHERAQAQAPAPGAATVIVPARAANARSATPA